PGVAGDPEDFERIPAGSLATAEDHYEAKDESWVQIESPELDEDCWVPRRLLRPSAGEDKPDELGETPGRIEFDVQGIESRSRMANSLMEAGLLKVIEPGEDVVGLALAVNAMDEEGIALLQKNCGIDDSILDFEIQEALETLNRPCPRLRNPVPRNPDSP